MNKLHACKISQSAKMSPPMGADHAEVADAATTKVTAPKKKAHWAVPEPSGVSTSNGRVSWENLGE